MALEKIDTILFDPIGCLAEFGSEDFDAIASKIFGRRPAMSASGSQAYWDVLGLLEAGWSDLRAPERAVIEELEIQAVNRASAYEDAPPALSELRTLGITLILGSSLSAGAVTRFLERFSLVASFDEVWSRDSAGGVKHVPLMKAITSRSLTPQRVMFITDTADGLQTAKDIGVHAVLMMNDPDEAMKLKAHNPAGGIVSFAELPDFVRFVAAEHARLP
jgi:beta-phosphoglucomutase-like phosphatase (HAD superfamily)